jgi:alkaline phosphatase D
MPYLSARFLVIALLLFGTNITAYSQSEAVTTIAIIGCHRQDLPAPSIPYLANTIKPQYTLWVGDNVYADTETDPQHIQRQLEVLLNKDGFKQLREVSKFMVTWDDHDYGLNDMGKHYVLKEESKQIHRKFWQLEEEIPTDHDGVYYAKLEKQPNGKVIQFIMLDGRFNRENPLKPFCDAFGENQWNWLEEQLKQPADVRFIINGYQILLKRPNRWEALVKLGRSRHRLLSIIKSTGANNVLFVTGDQHYVEVLRSPKVVKYKTFEIMAAGINNNERPGMAKNRVMGPDVTIHSAPVIELHWTAEPYIHFKNYNAETQTVSSEYKIVLSSLKWK